MLRYEWHGLLRYEWHTLADMAGTVCSDICTAPTPLLVQTGKIDSSYSKEVSLIAKQYVSDSTQISENYDQLLMAQSNAFNAKIEALREKIRYYSGKEAQTNRNYFSRKSQIQSAISQLEIVKNDSLTALVSRRNQELQSIRSQRNNAFSAEKQIYSKNQANLNEENEAREALTKGKIQKYGGFLAWFTIACLLFFLFSITLKEIHEKGSGIEHVAIPNQYFFEQGLISEFFQTLAEKIQCHARLWIKKWSEKTPEPPLPQPPPTLYDYSSLEQEVILVTNELFPTTSNGSTTTESPKKANGLTKEQLPQSHSQTKDNQNEVPLVSKAPSLFRHGPNNPSKLKETDIEMVYIDKSRTVEHYSDSQKKTLYYTMTDVNGFIKKYQERKNKAAEAYQENPTKGNLKTLQNQERWLGYWVGKREELEKKYFDTL